MKTSIAKVCISIALSFLISLVWWRLWMYEGFWGPVPFLHWFVISDGEGSYTLTELEMFVHLLMVSYFLHLVLGNFYKRFTN